MTPPRLGPFTPTGDLAPHPLGARFRAESAAVLVVPGPLAGAVRSRFAADLAPRKRLDHPGVAKFLGAGLHGGSAWVAERRADGLSAADLDAPLDWGADFFPLAVQLVWALRHAHKRGVLHRGLCAADVRLGPGGATLGGFGLVRALALPPEVWPPQLLACAAPEVLLGEPCTEASDTYSLGCVLYQLLAGRPAYPAADFADAKRRHCYTWPDRPFSVAPGMPPELDDLLCGLLAKHAGLRPASLDPVGAALMAIRDRQARRGKPIVWPPDPAGDGAATPRRRLGRAAPTRKRGRAGLMLALAVLAVAAGLLAALVF